MSAVAFDAVRLSASMETMFDSFRHATVRRAVTFDEVTLEDRPSDVLPNVTPNTSTAAIPHLTAINCSKVSGRRHARDAQAQTAHSRALGRNGHCDRARNGAGNGQGRWGRCAASEHECGESGRCAGVGSTQDSFRYTLQSVQSVRCLPHGRCLGGMIDRPICFFADDRISHLQHVVAENGFTFSSFPVR
jgi:hypothetical protein